MSEDLQELYQAIILDHNKRPRNNRPMPDHTHSADGHNPLCGDEITVFLKVAGGKVADISFQGEGCAISKASASLMTTLLKGKALPQARAEFARVMDLLTGEKKPVKFDEIGELAALAGVRLFPARVKCATLAWHAFNAALEGKKEASTE